MWGLARGATGDVATTHHTTDVSPTTDTAVSAEIDQRVSRISPKTDQSLSLSTVFTRWAGCITVMYKQFSEFTSDFLKPRGTQQMNARARRSTATRRWRSGLALAVISCGVMVLSSCGGGAAESSDQVIRGMGGDPSYAQATLKVSNTTLTGTVGSAIALTTSGGDGSGAVSFSVTGAGCSVSGTSLTATAAVTCVVTAMKAASTGYLEATSAPTSFAFTAAIAAVAQATLTVSNTTLTGPAGTNIPLTTSGGSGDGAVTFTVTGAGCSVSGTSLNATAAVTCVVTAMKAASTGYLEATSAPTSFAFTAAIAAVAQATLTVSNTTLTGPAGTNIPLTTSGGSGDGAVTFTVTGNGCSLNYGTTLKATAAATCIVTATKAASPGYLEATSAPTTFIFTMVAQATLTVSNTPLTGTVGTNIPLTTSGGSGTGTVTFTVTGNGCSLNVGTSLKATVAATCIVTATKAASTGYLKATSAPTTFKFAAK